MKVVSRNACKMARCQNNHNKYKCEPETTAFSYTKTFNISSSKVALFPIPNNGMTVQIFLTLRRVIKVENCSRYGLFSQVYSVRLLFKSRSQSGSAIVLATYCVLLRRLVFA